MAEMTLSKVASLKAPSVRSRSKASPLMKFTPGKLRTRCW
ncbi:Uncharacterised protein [Mycobacterium tuberculosis]|nr:Uncharacterised protein [Mycobacterium tuberculosis]